jgi:hypothetical protein
MAATPENIHDDVHQNILVSLSDNHSDSDSEESTDQTERYANSKIYVLWCDDEYYYIGSTINELKYRLRDHKNHSKQFPHRRVYAHINKIGWDDVKIELLEKFSCNSRKELLEKENEYICSLICDKMCLNEKAAHLSQEELLSQQAAYRQEHRDKILAYKERYRKEQAEKIAAYNKAYVEQNKEVVTKRKKAYNETNKEKIAATCKAYAETHKEQIAKYKKEYALEHAEELKQKSKEFREANKEAIAEKGRKYYEEKKDILLEKSRKYQEEHKEEIAKQKKEYREKKKALNLDAPKVCEVCGGSYQDYRKKRHEASKKHQESLQTTK